MWYPKQIIDKIIQIMNRLKKNRSKTNTQKCSHKSGRTVTWFWAASVQHGWCHQCWNEGVHEHFMNLSLTKILTLGKLVIPAPWASISLKKPPKTSHLSPYLCRDGLVPRHLKFQNDGTCKHLKFGRFALRTAWQKTFRDFGVCSGW